MGAQSHFVEKSRRRASPVPENLGTKQAVCWFPEEQFSYFSPVIAPEKKIISLGPTSPSDRSTDHERNHANAGDVFAPLLLGQLGGCRLGRLHRADRRRDLPARTLVTRHVARHHRRRTAT